MGPLQMENLPLPQSHCPGQHSISQGRGSCLSVCFSSLTPVGLFTSYWAHSLILFLKSFEHGPLTPFSTHSSPLCFSCLLTASSSWTTCSGLMRDDLRSHPHWRSATSRLEGGLSQARLPFCFISLWLRAWGSAFSFTQQMFF